MARRVRTSQSRCHPYHHPWLNPDAPGHMTSRCLAASLGVGTCVPNDLLSVRVQTPVTRFSMRLSTRAGRPRGGDPIYTTACFAGPEIQRAASTSTQTEA